MRDYSVNATLSDVLHERHMIKGLFEHIGHIMINLSRGMGFPTMWYVRPAKTQTSLA